MSEEILYINIDVKVSDTPYYGAGGSSHIELNVPSEMASNLDVGNIFVGCIKSAIANYEKAKEEKEE